MDTDKLKHQATQQCEDFLNSERAYNIEHSLLPSEVKIIDRLLARRLEMQEVYAELSSKLDTPATQCFLGLILSTAAFWNPDASSEARAKKRRLQELNSRIAQSAMQLSELIEERSEISNSSGFTSNTHYSICDLIEEAARDNHMFGFYVQKQLHALQCRYDLKYWPTITDVLNALSQDAQDAQVFATDPLTEAATESIRASLADYFRALFAAIDENSRTYGGFLPVGLRIADSALATIANCALDLDSDAGVDGPYVKNLRQRLRDKVGAEIYS